MEVPVLYEGKKFGVGYRADLLVEDQIIVELKSVDSIKPIQRKQLLSYLKIADKKMLIEATDDLFV